MEMETTRILIRENAEKAYLDLRDVRLLCNKINTELLPALEAMGIAPTAETVKESLRGKGAAIIEQYQADVERELRRIKIPAIRKKYEEEAAEPLQNFISIAESFSGMKGDRSAITFKDGKAFMSKAGEEAIREKFRIYAEGDQIETYRRHLEAAKALNTLMEDYPKGKEDFINLFQTLQDGTIIPKELSYWETVCKQQ